MHEKKAEVLGKLRDASRGLDGALGRMANVVLHPEEHGWRQSISAALIGLPIVAVSALVVDIGEVLVQRSSDSEWDRDSPPAGGESAAPNDNP